MDTFTPSNPDYEATVRQILLSMPYVQWLSLTFQRIAPGEVEFLMPHRAEITFDGKALQAGPIGSLLDLCRCHGRVHPGARGNHVGDD